MDNSKIWVIGDVHGEFGPLNTFINKKKPTHILSTGDLGYWPRMNPHSIIKAPNTELRFAPGNHEDYWSLKNLKDNQIWKNVWYMPNGSIWSLPDNRNVLFFGGALSVDKSLRIMGQDWFPEEIPSYEDISKLDYNTKIDIVISHTCPLEFDIGYPGIDPDDKLMDPTRKILSHILQTMNPKLWYFSHWHTYKQGNALGCKWICLDMMHGSTGVWKLNIQ